MTDTPISPPDVAAEAPAEDEDAPEIAADDAGASAFIERAGKEAETDENREGMAGEGV